MYVLSVFVCVFNSKHAKSITAQLCAFGLKIHKHKYTGKNQAPNNVYLFLVAQWKLVGS